VIQPSRDFAADLERGIEAPGSVVANETRHVHESIADDLLAHSARHVEHGGDFIGIESIMTSRLENDPPTGTTKLIGGVTNAGLACLADAGRHTTDNDGPDFEDGFLSPPLSHDSISRQTTTPTLARPDIVPRMEIEMKTPGMTFDHPTQVGSASAH
jgi:hypothetical protein